MRRKSFCRLIGGATAALILTASSTLLSWAQAPAPPAAPSPAQPQQQKPNILFIMGDDIGWMQVGIYHRGLSLGETPNVDRIGQEGAVFTDYYAMQSCTSGATRSSPACTRCAPA